MVGKNIKYYRLLNGMTIATLADRVGITKMAISNYENSLRKPDIVTLRKIADVFNLGIAKLLAQQSGNLVFSHGPFRKNSDLKASTQELVRESVEQYCNRFMAVVEVLGDKVLPDAPQCNKIRLSENDEVNGKEIRKWLGLSLNGPVGNLVMALENSGFVILRLYVEDKKFSGISGFVNNRPYIVVNIRMNPERQRSTIAHELAHLCFEWPVDMDAESVERRANSVMGAFLFPKEDAIRELGIRRSTIGKDMELVAAEYGISMLLLAMRAKLIAIITINEHRNFSIQASKIGWRKNEPSRICEEKATLFEQLAYRAVSEGDISIQKGAELLEKPYLEVERACLTNGGQ